MSKTTPKPSTSAELVVAGQPGVVLCAELRAIGGRLTTDQLCRAIAAVEVSQARFVTEAIALGILLEAKKQTLKHGDFQRFTAELWAERLSNGTCVSTLPPAALSNFTRSLRRYAFLGRHFLADLEQDNFQPDGEIKTKPKVSPADALALAELDGDKRQTVYAAIEQFAAGRSLSRLLTDFRRAESAADAEELAEDQARRRKSRKPADDPLQMDFFDDLKRAWDVFDTILGSAEFQAHATKDGLLQMATELENKAKALRAQAKATRT